MNFPFGGYKDCTSKEQILAKVRSAILEKDEKHFSTINLQDDTWKPFKEEAAKNSHSLNVSKKTAASLCTSKTWNNSRKQ